MTSLTIKSRYKKHLAALLPGQLVVQMTDYCNACCPQCSMRVTNRFKRHRLNRRTLFKIIEAAGENHLKAISFTGGEPMLDTPLLWDCVRHAGKNKIPFIRTGTNGFLFMDKNNFKNRMAGLVREMSTTPLRNFWISMDSAEPGVHESMRGFPGVFEGIARALPLFHASGIYPSVNLGINRNIGGELTQKLLPQDFINSSEYDMAVYKTYCQAFSMFFEQAVQMGFTIANACYPMSIDTPQNRFSAVYQACASDSIVRYTRNEKAMIFRALRHTIKNFRHRLRIFSPAVSLYMLEKEYLGFSKASAPCLGGQNYFFIDAQNGDTFPCGYRGKENMGKYWNLQQSPLFQNDCRRCDWECFRDPSELCRPFMDLMNAPRTLINRMRHDPVSLKIWARDLLYYKACDFFNGRIAPDSRKLQHFKA